MTRGLRCGLLAGSLLCSATAAEAQTGYTLFNPKPLSELRDLSTDRPDKTESPYTVDAGHIQVELDFATYTIDRDNSDGRNTKTESIAVVPINFKLGLTDRSDLQIVIDSYGRQTVTDRITGTRVRTNSFGDVTVRLKRNLWGDDGGKTAFALMPFVKLPTNSGGFGNNAVAGGIIAPLAIALSDGIGLGLMAEVDVLRGDADTDYVAGFVNSATLGFDLTKRIGLYTEIFIEKRAERGAALIVTFDSGVTYAVSDNIQLDAGFNLGVTDAADDLGLFVGLSRRF